MKRQMKKIRTLEQSIIAKEIEKMNCKHFLDRHLVNLLFLIGALIIIGLNIR